MEEIKQKGFSMQLDNDTNSNQYNVVDFSRMKRGIKNLEDAVLNLNDFKKMNPRLGDKASILEAINSYDLPVMREISNFFYRTSGIYQRLCRYMAYMYKYDWFVSTYINNQNMKNETVLDGFNKLLMYLDNFHIKKVFGEIALKVLKNGCYYGYIIRGTDKAAIQELPSNYCRTRFTSEDGNPIVEFNMRFFDEQFRDNQYRQRVLNMFPKEFKKGYELYKKGKLLPCYQGDISGWYMLDEDAIKFNLNGDDFPFLISVIPAIIDLSTAQNLDRKKMEQQLLKIIIQKMPIDKNGDLVFDVDEARELHNNAVRMLGKAVGIDVLTTFADTEVADMHSSSATTAADESMDRVKAAVYDQAGISQMQFNTDGNIALEKSVLNDEASLYNLIQQFEIFLNKLIKPFNKNTKKVFYKVEILGTTVYNYKELSKLYKEQTQLGYSKVLPQIALGQSQSSILATAYFENHVLDLVNVFIPPMSSNTMNAEVLSDKTSSNDGAGRPEKPDDEKSTKTIQNKESQ